MIMHNVISSNVHSVGYENGILQVAFLSGGVYAYYDVPEYVYHQLMNAPSKGKYFAANIKNRYDYRRIN